MNDELKLIHQKVMEFTFNCDNKASFLGAIIGVFFGGIASTNSFWGIINQLVNSAKLFWSNNNSIFDWKSFCLGISIFACITSLLVAIILILFVLLPKLGKKDTNSIIYFGSIGENPKDIYKDKVEKSNEVSIQQDYIDQIHICSKICLRKFRIYMYAVRCTIISTCAFALFMLFLLIFKIL